jgi:K+-sensing histidine kinase KdpD
MLSNAVKYNSSEIPEIYVRGSLSADHVLIDVIDNGSEVSREDVATIFEKFAHGSGSELDQGAGLGLPISRAIMRAMSGDLTLEFAPDNSSFFRLQLPTL